MANDHGWRGTVSTTVAFLTLAGTKVKQAFAVAAMLLVAGSNPGAGAAGLGRRRAYCIGSRLGEGDDSGRDPFLTGADDRNFEQDDASRR